MSIDLEMLWGGLMPGGPNIILGKGNEDRKAIFTLLNMLDSHRIGATWAIVGHLFTDRCDETECQTSRNMTVHDYRPEWYRDPFSSRDLEPLYYGSDVIEELLSNGRQEIGYHSYTHPVFTDIPREMAEEEIAQAKDIEREWGIELRSFVFPQNKVAHVDLLPRYGFTIFRGETSCRWRAEMPWARRTASGAMDKVLASPVRPRHRDGIWEIADSMPFCDPQVPRSVGVRAQWGLKRAIAAKQVFHIYLHPWNLLLYDRLRDDLDRFLSRVSSKRDAGKLQVMTMGEYAARLSEAKI